MSRVRSITLSCAALIMLGLISVPGPINIPGEMPNGPGTSATQAQQVP